MDYKELLKKRAKESRVYTSYQMAGLLLAEILNDESHKSLYIKLAKSGDMNKLIRLAKSVAEKKDIKNRGAYFMRLLQLAKKKQ
ncbi:MAG: hypothetical protein AUJ39_01510 [Parcubacteria group bacterium CG1_02_42_13]|nr:MAG: hypothetical protein AUJ39_01510 [Parcubacteria group bacterium CG1_02_42_13]